jgi:hypothetical protein
MDVLAPVVVDINVVAEVVYSEKKQYTRNDSKKNIKTHKQATTC